MRKLLLLLFLFALPVFAQEGTGTGVQYVNSAPVGRCGYQPPIQVVMLTGAIYTCANGNWVQNPGGSLSVTSINGVSGPFLFTGGGVSCTATTCVFATPPPLGVTSINATTGAFTFSGTGVNCTGTSCIFSGGGGSSGVQSINAVAGTFVFTGDAVSCTGTTCTFTQGSGSPGVTSINSNTGAFNFSGTGVACTGTNCVFSTGSGGITPGVPQQLPIYAAGGATIKGAANIYAIDPAMNQSQINSVTSGLSGQNTLILPAGAPQISYTANGQIPLDLRLGANYFQMPGVACDGKQTPLNINLTSGSSVSNVGATIGPGDVGKTFFFFSRSGYAYGSTQSVWTAKLQSYTFPNATWSASAPFNFSDQVYFGTDNLATINTAMTQASAAFPLTIPTGCHMLVNGPIQWNHNQVIVGRHMTAGGFIGRPGADIISTVDAGGNSVSQVGTGLKGFQMVPGTEVDWTLGYNLYAADGTLTVVPPVYRPIYEYPSVIAADPLAPGWLTGGKNGVASITQNSAVICTPNAVASPVVGQQIMFPYHTSIFTSTVSSTSGSCSAGFTARTLGTALPNTADFTSAQDEWFTGSAIQSTTTTIPTTITYPLTLTVTLSTDPVPGFTSNFPQTGHIKVCGIEADYGGVTATTVTLRKGPASSTGCTGTTPMAVMNPCAAKNLFGSGSDQPWPVIPSINAGDSTPSGANWFPGGCVGNAAIAFPTANGNTYVGAGLVGGFIEDIAFQGSASPNTNSGNANNVADIYMSGNAMMFSSRLHNLVSSNIQYCTVQGPASAGQHGVAAVGPTGIGNSIDNYWCFAGDPMAFIDLQSTAITNLNMNSAEISPFDGTPVGSSTCLQEGFTLDEQTGGVVTSTQYNSHRGYACEGENGSHAWVKPVVDIQSSHPSFEAANFEAIPNFFGGDHLKITNSVLHLPAVDYGTDNDFGALDGSNSGYITNIWDPTHPQFVEWGKNAQCSMFQGGTGPEQACGAALVQGYKGRDISPSVTASKAYYPLGGMITPWMWDANGGFDTNPFTKSGTPDPTAHMWGASSQCALGGGALCHTNHFAQTNTGQLYIGPFNQLYDGPYLLDATFKSVSASSSFVLTIKANDSGSGQCASGSSTTLYSGTVSTTTSYSPFNAGGAIIDMTGHAGCVLDVTYGSGSTTDTILTDRFNLMPQAQNLNSANVTVGPLSNTLGAGSGALTWTAPFNTGTGIGLDSFECHIQIGSGVEPFSQLVCDHPNGGTTGGNEFFWSLPVHFGNGINVQAGTVSIAGLTPNSSVCTDGSSDLSTSGCGAGGLSPKAFGGFGDALTIPNGCTTTMSSASVTCLGANFVSGDIGKQLWVSGAGAAGVAYGAAITAITSSTVVTLASPASTAVTAAYAVYGHDDVVAIQNCINASSLQGGQCFLGTPTPNLFLTPSGWLVASAGLLIPTHANIAGSSMYGGPNILSEYNGDLFSLTQGTSSLYAGQPVSGVTISNLGITHDPSQPAGRGFHLNSAAGLYGFGGMYYSTFTNVDDEGAALECLWSDGHTNSNDNPNQYLIFNNLVCNGPNQSHPAAEIKMTGIQAQILFNNGAINGTSAANYPNPLIFIGEKTTNGGDSPAAVTFFEFTYEVGTQGLFVGNGSTSIHFDNGYVENVKSPLIVQGGVNGLTFKGNNVANSGDVGAVAQFSDSVSNTNITATLQDNRVWGGSPAPAHFAVCSGSTNNFNIDFLNNASNPSDTLACATNHSGTGAALFLAQGTTATVDPSSQVITTINDPGVQAGKTLTLNALGSGAPNSFTLATGGTPSGNAYPINLGAFPSPLVVTAGNSVILALLDQGSFQWTVVGVTGTPFAGAAPTITGCGTISAQHGGATAGDFTTTTAGTCTAVIPLPTAPHGWHCDVTDLTQHIATNIMMQSATSATSCTVTGTTAASDVLSFEAVAY